MTIEYFSLYNYVLDKFQTTTTTAGITKGLAMVSHGAMYGTTTRQTPLDFLSPNSAVEYHSVELRRTWIWLRSKVNYYLLVKSDYNFSETLQNFVSYLNRSPCFINASYKL